jgi:uncharacterized membrane protein
MTFFKKLSQVSSKIALAITFTSSIAILSAQGMGGDAPAASGPVSFAKDVQPILQSRCIKCHGDKDPKGDLNLTTFENIMKGYEKGAVITTTDLKSSLMFTDVAIKMKMPPKKAPKLLPEQIEIISNWIVSGAANN